MLTGAPVLRQTFVGLGISSLVAIQFAPGSLVRDTLSFISFKSGLHLFWGMTTVLQLAQVERTIGSGILLSEPVL